MKKNITYSAYNDGTHIHHSAYGDRVCTQKHPKKLPQWAKFLIISGWLTAMILAAHLILKANNL